MELPIGVESIRLPNTGFAIIYVPSGIKRKTIKALLKAFKDDIILFGNENRAVYEDYKKKANLLSRINELRREPIEIAC